MLIYFFLQNANIILKDISLLKCSIRVITIHLHFKVPIYMNLFFQEIFRNKYISFNIFKVIFQNKINYSV